MKRMSLGKGLLILLVGLVGASCSKDNEAPLDAAPAATSAAVHADALTMTTSTATTTVTAPPAAGSPIGYAAMDGITTGGQGGQEVTVTTLEALKSALASASPMIINISGTISGSEGLTVKSDKTIRGVNGGTLDGIGFLMYGVNNIIVSNLTIQNLKSSDGITMKSGTHHVWIDHCTFQGSVYDGFLDVTRESDYVTISWSKFSGAAKNVLIGADDAHTSDQGKLRVTLHHNWFDNNFERSPSVRYGQVHVFNNYYSGSNTSYGVAARIGSNVRTDNNYFENFSGAPLRTLDPSPGVISGASTNVYTGSGSNKISTAEGNWAPSYAYASALAPATDVPAAIKAGAGAR